MLGLFLNQLDHKIRLLSSGVPLAGWDTFLELISLQRDAPSVSSLREEVNHCKMKTHWIRIMFCVNSAMVLSFVRELSEITCNWELCKQETEKVFRVITCSIRDSNSFGRRKHPLILICWSPCFSINWVQWCGLRNWSFLAKMFGTLQARSHCCAAKSPFLLKLQLCLAALLQRTGSRASPFCCGFQGALQASKNNNCVD